MQAETPEPPYVAVIFTSVRTADDDEGYAEAARHLFDLVAEQPGYLGHESVRDPVTRLGITVSYWATDDAARAWKRIADHLGIQGLGRERWYATYHVRVATVGRAYGFGPRR